MADDTAKGNQGKRYSAEEKAEILDFIKTYNEENKRGGMKTASEKYGVSVVTLSNWSKAGKGPKKRKARAKKVVAKKTVKTVPKAVTAPASSPDAILARMQTILVEIATLEKEYNTLKKQL